MKELENELERDLLNLYKLVKKEVYNPKRFHSLIMDHGDLEAARRLLSEKGVHEGLQRLWEEKKLSLSFEAFILKQSKYHQFFSEDMLNNARMKLKSLDYSESTIE